MAIRTMTGGANANRPAFQPTVNLDDFDLPTEKSEPSHNLSDYIIFLFGQRKIGKTSMMSNFPDALHLFFEPGGKGLSTYPVHVDVWEKMQKTIDLLYTSKGDRFQNVIVDTADICYDLYQDWYCRKEFIDHPSTPQDYGKTWDLLKAGFAESMHALTHAGKGVIFISHAKELEIKTRNMGSWTKIVPTLRDRAAAYIMGASDMNCYYGYFGNKRFLVIDGSEGNEDLGGRMMKHHFRTPGGDRIVAIPMGRSDEEAYANFMAAFNNQQEETYEEIHKMPEQWEDHSAVLKAKMTK